MEKSSYLELKINITLKCEPNGYFRYHILVSLKCKSKYIFGGYLLQFSNTMTCDKNIYLGV
jgi:hypothetical protein